MTHTMAGITAEVITSIRAHYATGHFDRETALGRIRVAGFGSERTAAEAEAILDNPTSLALITEWTGRVPCVRCQAVPSVGTCCSSHGKDLCHGCYKHTHFVEVCIPDCGDCARENAVAVTR